MWTLKQTYFLLAAFAATTVAQEQDGMSIPAVNIHDPPLLLTSLQGYPGTLSREAVQEAVDADIRNKIHTWYEQGRNNNSSRPSIVVASENLRALKEDENSFDGLNDILNQIIINIPPINIMEDVLGTTATVNVVGTCGGIQIDNIYLDYEKEGSSSLTYKVLVENLDIKCQFLVDWDLGVLDVSDKLKIKIVLDDNNFAIAVTLLGSPPDTSTFNGCEAEINVDSIEATGGFSANILNELEDLILNIVAQETEVISDILCEQVANFTDTIDELLVTLGDTLAPYLTRVIDVDPLELENNLVTDEELVDFTDSTIGDVLMIFIDNLDGVVGAFQINTLIELNLLDENGVFTIDLTAAEEETTRRLQDAPAEECSILRRRKLEESYEDVARRMTETLQEEFANLLGPLPEFLERQLQDEAEDTLFAVNQIDILSVEVVGLNTFVDTNYLEIIGKQTLRSVLQLTGLAIRVTILIDIDLANVNIVETVQATIPIDGIDVTASFLVGLSKEKVSQWSLGTFLPIENAIPCLISSLVVVGVSELTVTVDSVETAQVEGFIDTGIDNLINTAVEAALCTYQDLILIAIPNIFQNNVTVLVNDFLECFIRQQQAASVCPEVDSGGSALTDSGLFGFGGDSGGGEGGDGGEMSFSFEGDSEASTTFTYDISDGSASTGSSSTGASSTGFSSTTSPGTSGTNGLEEKSGSFIGTDSSYQGTAVSGSNGAVSGFIDFRDLLLPAEEARNLGGSGTQPYGNLISMAFDALKAQMVAIDNTTGLPAINSFLIQPLTESQSGVDGLLRFPQRFFNMSFNSSELGFLQSLLQRVEISAFDARIDNLNTIVNPVKFLEPSDEAHVLENIFHFGPVSGRPLNMTVSLSVNLDGLDSPLSLSNEIDISAFADELDVFTNFRIMIPTQKFLQFPLVDILNFNCWLALIQAPNMDLGGGETIENALAIKTFVMKVVSMAMDLKCMNCTSTSLPGAIDILEEVGATKMLGDRLGLLLEEIMTSDVAPVFLTEFLNLGEEAARLCPHSPTFNTTSDDDVDVDANAVSPMEIPPLSSRSVDTLTFATILGAEILAIVFAESHLRNVDEPSDALSGQTKNALEDDTNLMDFTNLGESDFPLAEVFLQKARGFLGGTVDESGKLGVNQVLQGFLEEDGSYFQEFDNATFEMAGVEISMQAVHVTGLDSFVSFDVLQPFAPQTLQNSLELEKISLKMDISVNVTTSSDPPQSYAISLDLENLNATAFTYAAIDMKKLANLEFGSLLYMANILPCFLSTASDIHIPAIQVMVGNISKLAVEGLFPETGELVSASIESMFQTYGSEMMQAINLFFDGTVKTLINGYLGSLKQTECRYYAPDTESRYVDFRDMFLSGTSATTGPYGDLPSFLKQLLQTELLTLNPDTQMPKINDVLIAPFTKSLSGVAGSLSMSGSFFGFNFQGLRELGIDNVGFELKDAQAVNLDTFGAPFVILEPNKTDGSLLDNRATLGTELRPLHFGVKSSLSINGSLLETHDEMEFFGELQAAPLFAVLLARIGSEELLTFPLQYITDTNCWLATIAAPALLEIGRGETQVDPVLAIPYVEMLFSSMHVGVSCDNCTTPGMKALPELLQILEESGTKDVLGHRTLELAMELLESDFSQVWIMRILQDAMRKCARTESMKENSIVLASPEYPDVSPRWLETGAFAIAIFAQTGAVILAETVAAFELQMDPVFDFPELDIPEETRMVDFTALDTLPVGGLVKYFIEGTNSFLGEESTDPESGETTLGVNEMLGDNPIFPLDSFSMEFNDYGFDVGGVKIMLKNVSISGLDTFTKFQVMNITGPNMLQNELGWENLQLEIAMEVDAGELYSESKPDEKMSFSLMLEAEDIQTSLELMLALDYELLKNLQLGSLLRIAHILPCIQATVRHMEITDVVLDIGKISKMRLTGFESEDTATAAEGFERLLLEEFGESLADAAPSLFSVAVRPVMNNAITSYLRNSDFKCNEFSFDDESAGFIDFRDMFLSPAQSKRYGGQGEAQYGDLLRTAYGILQLGLMMADPDAGIEMLTPILGNLSFPGVLINQGIRFDVGDIQADITLRVSDFQVENLDSLGRPLSVLTPVKHEAHQLNNSATLGIGNRPVSVGARFYMHIKGIGGIDVVNDFDLSLDIHAATIVLTALLKVSEMAFVRFPLRDSLNLNCWLAMIPPPALDEHGFREAGSEPTAGLTNLDMIASKLDVQLNCHNCTSPALFEFAELLAAPGSPEDMTDLANRVIDSVTGKLGGGFLQDQINRLLVQAPKHCGHNEGYDPNADPIVYDMFTTTNYSSSSSYISMLIVIMVPLLFVAAAALGVRHIVRRREKRWLMALPSERIFLIQQKQEKKDQEESEINELTASMYKSEAIPFIWRQMVPVIVVVNIGFFLSGHLSKGGRIMVNFVFAGQPFAVDDFFTFSIGQSTVDMWHAGGKELALLILLFSGVWPYTKQLITLALWFLPPSMVSCSRRGQFLLWLDILAKWSMIDIIVMLITVAGFRVRIESPDFAFVPKDFYSVDLLVVPMWGLYANMIAQLISQVSSHYVVHYHRRVISLAKDTYNKKHGLQPESELSQEKSEDDIADDDGAKEQLCQQTFSRPHRNMPTGLAVRRFINYVLLFGSLVLCVILAVSCGIPSLKLETLGVVGLLIELGQNLEPAVRYEGVFSIAKLLIDQAKYLGGFTNYIGMGFLAFLFVLTVFIVPVMQIATLVFHWFAPLAPKRRKKVALVLEILQAWQYVEVYILAILIESWQLGSISKLMLNQFCTSLDFTLNMLVYYGILEQNDAQCFALEASITAGAYLLVPITMCMALLNTFVVKAYIQQLREKEEEKESMSEDEKLRAFDRTTWDSRDDAMQTIRPADILFSDTFRWALRAQDSSARQGSKSLLDPASKQLTDIETFPLADITATSSDEEHGPDNKSLVESEVSVGIPGGEDYGDAPETTGTDTDNMTN